MRKIIAIGCLMAAVWAHAKTVEAWYDVSFGMFGKIGRTHAVLEHNETHYSITMSAQTTGMAKGLSNNRQETHRSIGRVRDGVFVAERYEAIRTYGDKKVRKLYRFDHQAKKIYKVYEKYKNGKRYDRQERVLPFYSSDDLLTLYFNLGRYIDKSKPGTYRFKAAGAERQDGEVVVIVPTQAQKAAYVQDLGGGAAWYATAIIHQKIFGSKEGRLALAAGQDGITQKALLKDVALFGDVTVVRVK